MSEATDRIVEYHTTRSFGTHQRRQEAQSRAIELYRSLGPVDVQQLVALGIESKTSDKHGLAEDVLRSLACLRPGSLAPYHAQLIEQCLYYPPVAFHGASSRIAERIFKALDAVGTSNRVISNHMLSALAWIGDELVQRTFDFWRRNPPRWASSLHVAPHSYAQQAGWEVTAEGGRRNLFFSECHPLVKVEDEKARPDIVKVIYDDEDQCPWCDRPMTTMLELNLARPELMFVGVSGKRLRITSCPVCTCYGTVFTKIGFDGSASWHKDNEKPGFLPDKTSEWDRLPAGLLVFRNSPRHWIEAADWGSLVDTFSQLGGHPTWIQEAYYPECLECRRLMIFVAQLAVEEIEQYGEGIYYMCLCGMRYWSDPLSAVVRPTLSNQQSPIPCLESLDWIGRGFENSARILESPYALHRFDP